MNPQTSRLTKYTVIINGKILWEWQ